MSVPGHTLDRMFNPKTVAVIGDKGPNYMWLRNNQPFKDQGGNLYSVQIDEKEIPGIEELGIENFRALTDIPEPVDYAIVAVPRHVSPYVMKDLIEAKVGGAAFFTSGFAETGEELGVSLQAQLTEMAREADFNVVGPNCMGLYLPRVGVRFNPDVPVAEDGGVGFVSAVGDAQHHVQPGDGAANGIAPQPLRPLRQRRIVLDISDYLEYSDRGPENEVIANVRGGREGRPRAFGEGLRAATAARKPVVVWKGGQTDAGARAPMSHTGSLGVAAPRSGRGNHGRAVRAILDEQPSTRPGCGEGAARPKPSTGGGWR